MRFFQIFLMSAALSIFSSTCWGQLSAFNGSAQAAVETGFFSSEPSREEVQRVASLARSNAWKNYTSTFDQARFRQIAGREAEIQSKLDQFINDTAIVDQVYDSQSKTLRVTVRITVNIPRVNDYFSSISRAAANVAGGGSKFGFLFLATAAESTTSFDARRTSVSRRTDSREASEANQERSESRGGVSREEASASASNTQSVKLERGGSVTRQADRSVKVDIGEGDLSSAFVQRMSTANFEATNYSDLDCDDAPTIEAISEEFAKGKRIGTATRRGIFRCADTAKSKYFAISTLDVTAPFIDSVTGLKKVVVSVSAQIYLTANGERRQVASVGPLQASATGPDDSVATRTALSAAATEAANSIIDQLNAKGLN